MSRADNAYDNAFMEFCFSRFKAELVEGGAFDSRDDAQTEIFEFIEMYYNTKPRHSSLKYQSPMAYEKSCYFITPKQRHCPSKSTHLTIAVLYFDTAKVSGGRWSLITKLKNVVTKMRNRQEYGV